MLDLIEGSHDLSRRAKLYRLHGLSFREYLNFTLGLNLKPLSFQEILEDPNGTQNQLKGIDRILPHFEDSKEFSSLTYKQLQRFAAKALLPETIVIETAQETVHSFEKVWRSIHEFPLDTEIIHQIDQHLKTIPLFSGK